LQFLIVKYMEWIWGEGEGEEEEWEEWEGGKMERRGRRGREERGKRARGSGKEDGGRSR
jgi:hypothetical protein